MCSVCFPGPACSGQVMPNYENQQKEKKMKQKKHKSLLHSSSLYILLMLAILLTGCGSKGEEQGETQSDVQAEEQTEPSAAEFLKEDGMAGNYRYGYQFSHPAACRGRVFLSEP